MAYSKLHFSAGVLAVALAVYACASFPVGSSYSTVEVPLRTSVQIAEMHSSNPLPTSQPVEVNPSEPLTADSQVSAEALNIETQLEEIGSVMADITKAIVPLAAVVAAFLTGAFFRKSAASASENMKLRPMEMEATEVTPLSRRGALTALSTISMMAASPAFAAKSGGRVGGSSFRSFSSRAAPPPPAAAAPQMGGGVAAGAAGGTTVFVTPSPPPVVVSPYGGYGMAPAVPFGFGFSTGELLALSALELGEAFVREQRRQAFLQQQLEVQRKLGQDEAQIQALQKQLAEQDQRMRELQSAMNQKGVPAPAQ